MYTRSKFTTSKARRAPGTVSQKVCFTESKPKGASGTEVNIPESQHDRAARAGRFVRIIARRGASSLLRWPSTPREGVRGVASGSRDRDEHRFLETLQIGCRWRGSVLVFIVDEWARRWVLARRYPGGVVQLDPRRPEVQRGAELVHGFVQIPFRT
ncbi:hypothetical protein PYCCODRAFT_1235175 [Trametes coccinea BRFM310]|uniref:Uncharacterized protein n=1 Tax=Trametes coccinea (strain BRFM310) TaxID=1353009 RepID=A0A1Y2IW84_TRAC3|nr:hypothetical protein PYCCODRAFT_1235175 [Trametes coccinea BRFM310]